MVEAMLRARRHRTQLSFLDGCSALRRARMRRITCQVALAGAPRSQDRQSSQGNAINAIFRHELAS